MRIYWEMAVGLNFLVDLLLLYGTDRLTGFPGSFKRSIPAAALGSVYAGLCLLPEFAFLSGWLWRLVFLAGMCMIAFGPYVSTLRRGTVFFLLSMALGGLASGTGEGGVLSLIFGGLGVWLLCSLGGRRGPDYLPVTITHGGKTVALTALADTGNSLKDPLSGRPVIVVDARIAQKLTNLTFPQLDHPMETILAGEHKGLRLVPYSSVGKQAGMLLAICPDSLTVGGRPSRSLVAFAPQTIGRGRPFEALAGGSL